MQPIKSCATELNVRFFKVMMAVGDRDRRMGAATHSRLRQRVKRAVLGARPMRQLHPKKRTQSLGRGSAAPGRFCCKSLFALLIKNSLGRRRDFRVKMWGTSSPDGKLTGDLGNAIESTEIDGRRSRRPLAGKLSPGDFRLLQQYRPQADIICLKDHRVSLDPLSRIYGSVPVASACFIGVIGARRPHPITIPWRTRRRALLCVSA